MEIITREDARARGLTYYRTGRPCRMGHDYERYVSTGNCVECQRAHQKAYSSSKMPPRCTTMPPQLVHADDLATLLNLIDALNMGRGIPLARRPGQRLEGETDWERYLARQMRKPAGQRAPLLDLIRSAGLEGITESYSNGRTRPPDTWSRAVDIEAQQAANRLKLQPLPMGNNGEPPDFRVNADGTKTYL